MPFTLCVAKPDQEEKQVLLETPKSLYEEDPYYTQWIYCTDPNQKLHFVCLEFTYIALDDLKVIMSRLKNHITPELYILKNHYSISGYQTRALGFAIPRDMNLPEFKDAKARIEEALHTDADANFCIQEFAPNNLTQLHNYLSLHRKFEAHTQAHGNVHYISTDIAATQKHFDLLFYQLETLFLHGVKLKTNPNNADQKNKGELLLEACKQLKDTIYPLNTQYRTSLYSENLDKTQNEFLNIMHNIEPTLKRHTQTWKHQLANTGIFFTGIGALALGFKFASAKMKNQSFTLFCSETQSSQIAKQILIHFNDIIQSIKTNHLCLDANDEINPLSNHAVSNH